MGSPTSIYASLNGLFGSGLGLSRSLSAILTKSGNLKCLCFASSNSAAYISSVTLTLSGLPSFLVALIFTPLVYIIILIFYHLPIL